MPFPKGKSGNPGGRPKSVIALAETARESCPRAIMRATELLEHEDGRVVIAAATFLADRGMGKPPPTVFDLAEVPDEQLRAEVERRERIWNERRAKSLESQPGESAKPSVAGNGSAYPTIQ
jgi:hypothetical protein